MRKLFRNWWKQLLAVSLGCIALAVAGTSLLIGHDVREVVSAAQSVSAGDPVESLLFVVNSPAASFPEKNRAVWALGQLGNVRALEALEPLCTGEACDHSSALCQRELEKAIGLCRGDRNIGALVWRHGALASLD
jgi:PBS lyase HEAT-like repeat-containing protein